jgi:glycosyltransferase involved in cell wall biosynthesis
MRILVIVPEVFGQAKGGGERYIVEAVKALRNRGVATEVLLVKGLWLFQLLAVEGSTRTISLGEANQLVKQCDLIHVHQLNSPGFDYSALAARLFHKPLVLTDHGGGWRNPGRLLGEKRLHFVDAGAFVSEWGAQDVDSKRRIPIHRVVSGGGDHLPPAEPWEERFDFGFVGRILPHKGVHVIVEALPEAANLVIAGQARDPVYMEEIRRLADGKNVTFLQDAKDDVVAALYRSVRYLLAPSVFHYRNRHFARPELMGLVALEAMSAGTPVIGSDAAGLGEVLRNAGQITLPPGDVEAWRAGLTLALQQHASPIRPKEFTWDSVAQRCMDLYGVVQTERR